MKRIVSLCLALLIVTHASAAVTYQRVSRVTVPNEAAIQTQLVAALPPNTVIYGGAGKDSQGNLFYEVGLDDWTGVDVATIRNIITNAAADSPALQAKSAVDGMNTFEKACFLTLLDLINQDRTARGAATISANQLLNQIKNKIDNLP